MELIDTQSLFKRKKVGALYLRSKKDNYRIAEVYISPYIPYKNVIDTLDDKIKKFKKKMLKYFSYEIINNCLIKLYFDFDACKQELDIDVNEFLPIPYLIKIDIADEEKKESKQNYFLYLITERIINYENKVFDIVLKKAQVPNNEEFVITQTKVFYLEYYITHKYEEDWIKLWLFKNEMELKKNKYNYF